MEGLKQRKKFSVIWKMSTTEFKDLCENAKTMTEILAVFELKNRGGNSKTVQRRAMHENIDLSHLPIGNPAFWRGKICPGKRALISLEKVMVEKSGYGRGSLKRRLLKDKLIENKCAICDLLPEWKGKLLVLVLDHINGVMDDHRLENLRLVCPNCNSQQATFSGRNSHREYRGTSRVCEKCGGKKANGSKICIVCHRSEKHKSANKNTKVSVCKQCGGACVVNTRHGLCRECVDKKNRRVVRPSRAILEKEIEAIGYCGVGRKYGVSDNAIRKWLKSY